MKSFLSLITVLFLFGSCVPKEKPKNEVIIMGMIHGGHRTNPNYDLALLKNLIREIDPDFILTEIPPDRYPIARKEFDEMDTILEPRVRVFPEYVDAIFPLT
jgi:hypothetical protein